MSTTSPSPALTLTLLGTGMPIADPRRRGPSQVIEIGSELIMVDAGAGALHRFVEAGYHGRRIQRIALTHLHSDHITGLADLLWAGWNGYWWEEPPIVCGPPGTEEFVRRLLHAFEYDISIRIRTQGLRTECLVPRVEELADGQQVDGDDWRLTAFGVHHEPVDEAFGFRIDAGGVAIAISGDTRPSENLARHARDVDLLVHEVIKAAWMPPPRALLEQSLHEGAILEGPASVLDYHTHSDEVGVVAAAANAKQLILSHIVYPGPPQDLVVDAARDYGGPVVVGEDLRRFVL